MIDLSRLIKAAHQLHDRLNERFLQEDRRMDLVRETFGKCYSWISFSVASRWTGCI